MSAETVFALLGDPLSILSYDPEKVKAPGVGSYAAIIAA
jgi:hypothetical protein